MFWLQEGTSMKGTLSLFLEAKSIEEEGSLRGPIVEQMH